MQVQWTEAAAVDLQQIADYLVTHSPEQAPRLTGMLCEAADSLLQFPHRGRNGKRPGTRELVLTPLPWILVYAVRDESVYVVRILHGAQRWP